MINEPLHDHVREDRYTMVVLGTVARGARRACSAGVVGGDTVGLVAAAIAAISPNLWVNDGLVMSETVTGLMVVGAMLCAFRLRDRPTFWRAAALGALCGLAALARIEFAMFVVLLAIVVPCTMHKPWRERGALALVAVVTALLVVAPWVGLQPRPLQGPDVHLHERRDHAGGRQL